MESRRHFMTAAGGAAALTPVLLHGQTKNPPVVVDPSPAVVAYCSQTAKAFSAAKQAGNLHQSHVSEFVKAHRMGIAHLKEIGAIAGAHDFLSHAKFPLTRDEALQGQKMYLAYGGRAPEVWELQVIPDQATVHRILNMGLDKAAELVLAHLEQTAAALVLPAQDFNPYNQIAQTLMVTGAFWGLGLFLGCVICGVGGAILGIAGLITCWVAC